MNLKSNFPINIYISYLPIEIGIGGKVLRKKVVAIGIIIILIGINIGILSAKEIDVDPISPITFDGNTLYVGGNGPNNYTRIQDAIDNASNGDTVYVFNGTYHENVIINKSINLIGENKNTTSIDHIDGIEIVVDHVNMSGFTITHSDGLTFEGLGIYITSDYNLISGNIVKRWDLGIYLGIYLGTFYGDASSYNIISGNTFDTIWVAVALFEAFDNSIVGNYFTTTPEGVALTYSNNNTITCNTFNDGNQGIKLLHTSNNNLIHGNTITNQIEDGIFILYSHNNIISGNYFSEERSRIRCDYGSYNIFTQNVFIWEGIQFYGDSIHNNISYNEFNVSGIFCDGTSSHNEIRFNNFRDGSIWLDSQNNKVICNNFLVTRIWDNPFMNMHFLHYLDSQNNIWDGNFWFRPRILPRPILAYRNIGDFTVPWVTFDWNPALTPYDIGGNTP